MKLPTAALLTMGCLATAHADALVVIDPGHGGSNPGTKGAGTTEKRLTLELAKRVSDRLGHRRIQVRMTRTDDRTLTLRQRIAFAERAGADLFISIHANASPTRGQRGFETFLVTPRALEVDGRALRAKVAIPRIDLDRETSAILDDVERGAAQVEAAQLAVRVQKNLREQRGAGGDRGVRQEAHHVLLGATMPAVLVEVGFLDHPIEGKQLVDPVVQDKLATAIAEAIEQQLRP